MKKGRNRCWCASSNRPLRDCKLIHSNLSAGFFSTHPGMCSKKQFKTYFKLHSDNSNSTGCVVLKVHASRWWRSSCPRHQGLQPDLMRGLLMKCCLERVDEEENVFDYPVEMVFQTGTSVYTSGQTNEPTPAGQGPNVVWFPVCYRNTMEF